MELHSLRAALTLVLQRKRSPVPCRSDELRRKPPPVGVETVDVADGATTDALLLRRRRAGHRLRGRQLRQGRDADRHTGDVVAGPTDVGVGDLADVRTQGLAIRRGPDGLRCPLTSRGSRRSTARCTTSTQLHSPRSWSWDLRWSSAMYWARRARPSSVVPPDFWQSVCTSVWSLANFVYLWPILTAMPITPESWQNHLWLPSWK